MSQHREVTCWNRLGGVHIAQRAARAGHGGVDLLAVGNLAGHQHIAQALAGRERDLLKE